MGNGRGEGGKGRGGLCVKGGGRLEGGLRGVGREGGEERGEGRGGETCVGGEEGG